MYHTWDAEAGKWVITDDAQKQKKSDQILAASSQKVRPLNEATKEIAPLQDAVDLEMATDDEKAQLTAWKKYRVLLNRVDTSTATVRAPARAPAVTASMVWLISNY
ncbi:tail fiber assembly protein [Dickeya solani]|uniref:Tail fiber assembly protein n=1 Tax=Dickeya solani TaxID=1089444 RepID=A0ABU4EJZ7_9GAMM|nr:tail fiber assembly protein [Dickeya solani]MCA6999705.1 tail fiber assembly protein [Dickeya solani]MCZ0820350.1 tail fiber assembly protein [Dickeya solani]MDV6993916.1 tail fiber assembly protein [Dickeya solani]MDV7005272.1 tail fiber assembly protein [Dickeya solani]MDV7039089.1 tail fiber assembly protein [Dickeya solani]